MDFLRMSAEQFRRYIANGDIEKEEEKARKNKYYAQKTNGFDSKKEYKRYCQLKEWEERRLISGLETQKRFTLVEDFQYNGVKVRGVTWIADFYYFNGQKWVAEDVKSAITRTKPEYVIKKKLFMLKYPEILFNEFL